MDSSNTFACAVQRKLLLHMWSLLVKGKKNITKVVRPKITIYTDGGCVGRTGAWAFLFSDEKEEISKFGKENPTTNNRMELKAVIEALLEVERRYNENIPNITVHTDSRYVKEGITEWVIKWKNNGWKTAQNTPVKNKEIWITLDTVVTRLKPTFVWIKGHSGVEQNEKCDAMVKAQIKSHSIN